MVFKIPPFMVKQIQKFKIGTYPFLDITVTPYLESFPKEVLSN